MATITTAEIVRAGARLLLRNGLAQNAGARTGDGVEVGLFVKSPGMRYSMDGAVLVAFRRARQRGEIIPENPGRWVWVIEDELRKRGLPPDMGAFNDTPGRTPEEAADLLEATARTLDNDAKR